MKNGKNTQYIPKDHFESQKVALTGLKLILRNERNFRIQLIIASLTVIFGLIFNFTHRDWISISLLIGMVLIAEAFNSVIEALSDTLSQEYRVNIRYAKDVSAGAVLISAMVSVVAGVLIVFPYILEVVEKYLN